MLRPTLFKHQHDDLMNYFNDFQKNFFDNFAEFDSSFKTDIIDQGDHYILKAELPGFQKEDIQVDLKNGYLTIHAEHKEETEDKNHNYIRKERKYGSYSRSFYTGDMDVSKIEASYTNGILELQFPKNQEENSVRRIEIK